MNKVISLIRPTIDFVKINYGIILIVLATIVVLSLAYLATIHSLKKLKGEYFSYYPFDKFFPKSGGWSISYFLITALLLGLLVYAIIRGEFYAGPA